MKVTTWTWSTAIELSKNMFTIEHVLLALLGDSCRESEQFKINAKESDHGETITV